MRFPLRRRLFLPTDPAGTCDTFEAELETAVARATSLIARGRFPIEFVAKWKAAVEQDAITGNDLSSAAQDALIGTAFALVGQWSINQWGGSDSYLLAADGQRRLTRSLLGLSDEDRSKLIGITPKGWDMAISGAMSVARAAAALSELGAVCYESSLEEDAQLSIDLLCEQAGQGLCIQVKSGRPEVYLVTEGTDDLTNRLISGTARFNRKFNLRWLPVLMRVSNNGGSALTNGSVQQTSRLALNLLK